MTRPKPTALHELHGTGHPTRMKARKNEPVPEGEIGAAPDYFSPDQKAAWSYAVANSPDGVLYACDRGTLEVYIVAQDQHRLANIGQQRLDKEAGENGWPLLVTTSMTVDRNGKQTGGGNIIQSPYLGIMSSAAQRMIRAATELGFTPAARPRLRAGLDFDPAATPTKQARSATTKKGEKTERNLDQLINQRASLN